MSRPPPMPYCPLDQWTRIASRSAAGGPWKWDLGFDERTVRQETEMNNYVLMHERDGTAINLVCQPMTAAWRRVLRWASYR